MKPIIFLSRYGSFPIEECVDPADDGVLLGVGELVVHGEAEQAVGKAVAVGQVESHHLSLVLGISVETGDRHRLDILTVLWPYVGVGGVEGALMQAQIVEHGEDAVVLEVPDQS